MNPTIEEVGIKIRTKRCASLISVFNKRRNGPDRQTMNTDHENNLKIRRVGTPKYHGRRTVGLLSLRQTSWVSFKPAGE
jgi:hypothetical protein